MAAAWLRFRGLRFGVQVACWLLFFPLVAALAITRGQREPASRVVAGIVVLVVTVPIWLAAIFGANDPGDGEIAGPAPVEATQDVAPEAIPEPEPAPSEEPV